MCMCECVHIEVLVHTSTCLCVCVCVFTFLVNLFCCYFNEKILMDKLLTSVMCFRARL